MATARRLTSIFFLICASAYLGWGFASHPALFGSVSRKSLPPFWLHNNAVSSTPEAPDPTPIVDQLVETLETLERGRVHYLKVKIKEDGAGCEICVPAIVIRGAKDGKVLGVTAAIHGNELNGIPVIHRLVKSMVPSRLAGTLVAVPVVNVPGYLANKREFRDGIDLNRIMPGRESGSESQVYAHRFMERVVKSFNYIIDLHTASFGRLNSLYVRADMSDPIVAQMAAMIDAQIIINAKGSKDGPTSKTLRQAAADLGIHGITVEVGDPNRFQEEYVCNALFGIQKVIDYLGMYPAPAPLPEHDDKTIMCSHSYWIYTDDGGLLEVFPEVASRVEKGERIAKLTNVFGELVKEYVAPESGFVVGRSNNPVAHTGARILHLGIEE